MNDDNNHLSSKEGESIDKVPIHLKMLLTIRKAAEYSKLQSDVTTAARRGYVDTIIASEDTRKYLIGALEMLFTKREDRPSKKHGTV